MNSGIMADCAGSWNIAPQSPFAGSMRAAVRRFARSSRGGAVLELALGAVVLTTTAAVCFDIYSGHGGYGAGADGGHHGRLRLARSRSPE